MSTAVAIARSSRGSTLVPGSTQGEAGQGAATASEAGLDFPAAEGVGFSLWGSSQGETGEGSVAASEAVLLGAAAEVLGVAEHTISRIIGAGHSVLCPSAGGGGGFSLGFSGVSARNVLSCRAGALLCGSTAWGGLQLKRLIGRLKHLKGGVFRDPRHLLVSAPFQSSHSNHRC